MARTLAQIEADITRYEALETKLVAGGLQAFSAEGRSGELISFEKVQAHLTRLRAERDAVTRGGSVGYGVPV